MAIKKTPTSLEVASMNFSALAAWCARVTPSKLRVALPLSIMGVFYWLSSLPGTPMFGESAFHIVFYWMSPPVQNALHIPAYAALAWAWHWALGAWLHAPAAQAVGACVIASAYGVLDEFHQSFVPGRDATLIDVALNLSGVAFGIWLAARMRSRAGTVEPRIRKD